MKFTLKLKCQTCGHEWSEVVEADEKKELEVKLACPNAVNHPPESDNRKITEN